MKTKKRIRSKAYLLEYPDKLDHLVLHEHIIKCFDCRDEQYSYLIKTEQYENQTFSTIVYLEFKKKKDILSSKLDSYNPVHIGEYMAVVDKNLAMRFVLKSLSKTPQPTTNLTSEQLTSLTRYLKNTSNDTLPPNNGNQHIPKITLKQKNNIEKYINIITNSVTRKPSGHHHELKRSAINLRNYYYNKKLGLDIATKERIKTALSMYKPLKNA